MSLIRENCVAAIHCQAVLTGGSCKYQLLQISKQLRIVHKVGDDSLKSTETRIVRMI